MKGRITRSLAFLLLSSLAACQAESGDPPNQPTEPLAPLGVAGKPLTTLSTGLAIADELLVRFAPGIRDDQIDMVLSPVRGEVTYRGRYTGYHVIRFAGLEAMLAAREALGRDPWVIEVVPNHVVAANGPITEPSFQLGILQWNLFGMEQDPFGARFDAQAIVVAVLDSGIAYEEFSDALGTYARAPGLSTVTFAPGFDFINDDTHANDDQGHGTHVAGVIAASNGEGPSGIAAVGPGADLMPVKVLDASNTGTELALAEGIRFAADHGADVVNMSLTFPLSYFPSRLMQSAVDHASRAGVIMVAAAGNHGQALVAYPAAFRDVIAVGGSDLPDGFITGGEDPWDHTIDVLERADYSNHSYKLDVLAPSGSVDKDANGDGHPEGVLAETFAAGDPTAFDYYFMAGTSQASAEVSGIVSVMLARGTLSAHSVRAVLTETALEMGSVLSLDGGRGRARLPVAGRAARHPHADETRPRFHAGVAISLHDRPGGTVAVATVEILDSEDLPVVGIDVFGMFTGAAFASVTGTTGAGGLVTFESAPLSGEPIVAFQVDAVIEEGCGRNDRDSDSDDDSDSDSDDSDSDSDSESDADHKSAGHGRRGCDCVVFDRPRGFIRTDSESLSLLSIFGVSLGTPPSDPTGAGPITEPSGGRPSGAGPITEPSFELPTDPALTPISIGFDPALFGSDYRRTLLLPNFSWGLATAPMAVAVDEAWFLETFPGAAERRVVSYGLGYGGSALLFDLTSFPSVVDYAPSGSRIPIVVLTFLGDFAGIASSIHVDPSHGGGAFVAACNDALAAFWSADVDGPEPSYADSGGGLSEAEWTRLSALAAAYLAFAPTMAAAPVGSYGDALAAAGMPVAPVPLGPSSGGGAGRVPLNP